MDGDVLDVNAELIGDVLRDENGCLAATPDLYAVLLYFNNNTLRLELCM